MKLRTIATFLRGGRLRALIRTNRMTESCYRTWWLAAAARHGVLKRLAEGSATLDALAAELAPHPGGRDALEAWLGMGVRLGELAGSPDGYRLRGLLARELARPEQDAIAAIVEEVAGPHQQLVLETPELLRRGEKWGLSDWEEFGELIARSSRLTEPFVYEAIDEVLSRSGAVRLLEVGAGSGTYIRYCSERNPELCALGLELQPDVAKLANRNLEAWGLGERARVDEGDVLDREPDPAFDLATLHNNIYYFEVERRVPLLRHLRGFLRPGGRILLTTGCRGGGATVHALDIWGAMTRACGRLPDPDELPAQLAEAGFGSVRARSLIPGERYYAFSAVAP